jgi:hypothetical protein
MQARSELLKRFQEAVHGADTVKLLLELYPLDERRYGAQQQLRGICADHEAVSQTSTG